MRRFAGVLLFLLLEVTCVEGQKAQHVSRLLFVGNSLTYTNNLPALVEAQARKEGRLIGTKLLAFPNYALEDHWRDGELQLLIASGQFDYVIVQQGPSSQAEGKTLLLEYGKKIKDLCDLHQVKMVFFMVWPAKVNYHTFQGVIDHYTEAADVTNSILCPVGKVWKEYMDANQDYSYYGTDFFHPSRKGSIRAAEIIVASLF